MKSEVEIILNKQKEIWNSKAIVRNQNVETIGCYDLSKRDFNEDLLPFYNHSCYEGLSEDIKYKILACAWIHYNQKTISLELEVVNPLCNDILLNKVAFFDEPSIKQLVTQIMVDESYHVLMVLNSNEIVKNKRNLDFNLGTSEFVKHMKKEQSKTLNYEDKFLIQFALAITAEIFTSKSMAMLSKDKTGILL